MYLRGAHCSPVGTTALEIMIDAGIDLRVPVKVSYLDEGGGLSSICRKPGAPSDVDMDKEEGEDGGPEQPT